MQGRQPPQKREIAISNRLSCMPYSHKLGFVLQQKAPMISRGFLPPWEKIYMRIGDISALAGIFMYLFAHIVANLTEMSIFYFSFGIV